MSVSNAKRLKELEAENARLKKLLGESLLKNKVTREALRRSGKRTITPRVGVPYNQQGLSERRAMRVIGMSASAYLCRLATPRIFHISRCPVR